MKKKKSPKSFLGQAKRLLAIVLVVLMTLTGIDYRGLGIDQVQASDISLSDALASDRSVGSLSDDVSSESSENIASDSSNNEKESLTSELSSEKTEDGEVTSDETSELKAQSPGELSNDEENDLLSDSSSNVTDDSSNDITSDLADTTDGTNDNLSENEASQDEMISDTGNSKNTELQDEAAAGMENTELQDEAATDTENTELSDTIAAENPAQLSISSGRGTKEDPYLIGTLEEFLAFAAIVNGTASGTADETGTQIQNTAACARLTADIGTESAPVRNDAVVGISESNPYTGEFDGAGYQIFVNLSVTTTSGTDPAALFKFTNGATIHDLVTAGTIATSNKFAGGIVGSNSGNALHMYQCGSTVEITSSVNGDGTHGGLIAKSDGTDLIEDCYFSGKIDGASTNSCGGIAGWMSNGGAEVRNCYVNASYTVQSYDSNNIARGNAAITNCYYVNELGNNAGGTKATEDDLKSGKLTWLLNENGQRYVWRQTLDGEDKAVCPQFYGKTVFFNETTNAYYNDTAIIERVLLEASDAACYTGSMLKVAAVVNVTEVGEQSKIVSFSVEGNTSADTKIEKQGSQNALLIVGKDETAQMLTVKATSVSDPTKEATLKVKILESSFEVTVNSDMLGYTGESQVLDVLVKNGDIILAKDTDYTVTYLDENWVNQEDVREIGTYFARIDGIGTYEGQNITKKFSIVPQKEITIENGKNINIYPDGYKIGNGEKVPYVGIYVIVGDGTSKNGELNFNAAPGNQPWTYNVTFRDINLTNKMYYSVIKVKQNITLNLAIEGENCVTGTIGNYWEPISTDATEQYPTINLTMKDNSKLTLIAQYKPMVKNGITVNLLGQETFPCSNLKEEQINWTSKTDAEGIWIRKSHKFRAKDLGDGANHSQSCQYCSKMLAEKEPHTWKSFGDAIQKKYEVCGQCGAIKIDSIPMGSGTKESPYLIESLEQFKIFANIVNGAEGFPQNPNAYAKLTKDIGTEAEPVGNDAVIGISESNPYTGGFDGAGHKIFVNLSVDTTPGTGTDPAALFKFTDGATIHDLVTDGTIKTSNQFAGGIVGSNAKNPLTMQRCGSSVAITSYVDGDGTHGGLLGKSDGADTIENCYFSGKIEGTNTTSCGGIAGWIGSKDAKIKNCYVNASYTVSGEGSDNIARRKDNNLISFNCYYLNELNTNSSGMQKTAEQFASGEVTWLLNNNGERNVWKQTLTGDSPDAFPKFDGERVFYNAVTSKFYNSNAVVTKVALDPIDTLVFPGTSVALNASVEVTEGTEDDKLLVFSINGNTSVQTKIEGNQLFVGADEKAETITVRVTSAIDSKKYAEITVDIITMQLSARDFVYTGDNQLPEVSVKFKGKTLENGNDYRLRYFDENGEEIAGENIKEIGKYKVEAKGTGEYEGVTLQEQFRIWKAEYAEYRILNIEDGNITIYSDGYEVGDNGKVNYKGKYIITGSTQNKYVEFKKMNMDNIDDGTDIGYDVMFSDLSIRKANGVNERNVSIDCGIKGKITLNLTIEGENTIGGSKSHYCIESLYAREWYYPKINITMGKDSNLSLLPDTSGAYNYAVHDKIEVKLMNPDILECSGKDTTNWSERNKNIILRTLHHATIYKSIWDDTYHGLVCEYCQREVEKKLHEWKTVDDGAQGTYEVCKLCNAKKSGIEGSGTKESPYLIYNADELKTFANIVNAQNGKTSAYAKLMKDIGTQENPVGNDAVIGISKDNAYKGNFDGAGHTIFVDLSVDTQVGPDDPAALFKFTDGATIHDLTTAGKIRTSNKYAGGIVGVNGDNALHMYQCGSTVAITSNVSGDGTHGGLLGKSDGADTIEDCYFSGKIDGASTNSCGGIAGWMNSGGARVRNCYVNASYTVQSNGSNNIARGSNVDISNCYYVNTLSDYVGGIKVTAQDLSSGKLTYLLNNNGERNIWKQTLDGDNVDAFPNFKGKRVVYNSVTSSYYNSEAVVNKVTFNSAEYTATCGSFVDLDVSVDIPDMTGDVKEEDSLLDFSISGNSSDQTIVKDGKLFVGQDEKAETITIKAVSAINPSKEAQIEVKIAFIMNISNKNMDYTGEVQTPIVSVKDKETVLTEGTDYTLIYIDESGNEITKEKVKDIGRYQVRAEGIGDYEGAVSIDTFYIWGESDRILNIEDGIIEIYHDGYKIGNGEKLPYTGKYILTGSSDKYYVDFFNTSGSDITYDVTFRDFSICGKKDGKYGKTPIVYVGNRSDNAKITLNLTVEGENKLEGNENYMCIEESYLSKYEPAVNIIMTDNSSLELLYYDGIYPYAVQEDIIVNVSNREMLACCGKDIVDPADWWKEKTNILLRTAHKLDYTDLLDGKNHSKKCQYCDNATIEKEPHTWSEREEGGKTVFVCELCNAIAASFSLELTSRIENAKDGTTVTPMTGGGKFPSNSMQTVKADKKEGYDFVGWFAKDNSEKGYDEAKLLSSQLEYRFELTSDTSLVAVYRPDGKMTLEVKGPQFIVNGGTEQTSGNYSERFNVGTQITVKATGENFAYWSNASSKIMSTNQEYTFTLVGNTVLTAVYKNAAQNTAFVEFVSGYGQVMQAASYTADDTIEIPVGPSKLACDFVSWNMTAEEIKAKIESGETYIRVIPIYEQKKDLYTVKVFYDGDDSLAETYENKEAGSTMTVTAKDIQDKKFAYWALDKEGTTVAATDKSYFFTVIKDMELYAIYVSEDEAVETKPVVNVTDHYSIVDNNVNKVVFVTNRDVPEGYTVLEAGALYGVDASFGQEGASDAFVIGAKGVKQMISSSVSNKGIYVLSIRVGSSVDKIVYSRGYVIVQTPDGVIETIYSDISHRSHNSNS